MYFTIPPHPALAAYIDAYWVSHATEDMQLCILPDSCADIIINIGSAKVMVGSQQLATYDAFTVGTMTVCNNSHHTAGSHLLGIRFRAGGMKILMGFPLHLLTDDHIPVSDISSEWQEQLQQLLETAPALATKISRLNQFFLSRLTIIPGPALRIQEGLRLIRQANGNIRTTDLAHATATGIRNFEKQFKEYTGVSAKTFCRITRFLATKAILRNTSPGQILQVALEVGYYDHAHLSHEFREMAGAPPETFLRQ
ncbi:helix-turn-helix protein [Chitinophaga dinghuensis]|uniref:Helix-turn-helix protein n=1 Tax=Chitinophaga dinghuensis TaxID=1539050 RepID=A0A327WD22_9BACT|nr:helix-turn-helix domain-containing protein [Chitinophaga dinghuensis]RAJ88038.1 helix-turn-helix protein [Chitinophaga dinghuensis]